MKSNYEEKRAARLEAYQNLAAKNDQLSDNLFERSNSLASVIPLGQPILVGHHSEGRHRAHIEKIHNSMDKGVEASKKAKYYEGKAAAILADKSIHSDDPNATEKLEEKLVRLQKTQELYKQINKAIKTGKTQIEQVDNLAAIGVANNVAIRLLTPDFCGRIGIPSYKLTNNNANINTIKKRLQSIEKTQAIPAETIEHEGITIEVSQEDNRVKIFFPGKPEEEKRKELKSYGFHWSPTEGAWMRMLSNSAVYYAKKIVEE